MRNSSKKGMSVVDFGNIIGILNLRNLKLSFVFLPKSLVRFLLLLKHDILVDFIHIAWI